MRAWREARARIRGRSGARGVALGGSPPRTSPRRAGQQLRRARRLGRAAPSVARAELCRSGPTDVADSVAVEPVTSGVERVFEVALGRVDFPGRGRGVEGLCYQV